MPEVASQKMNISVRTIVLFGSVCVASANVAMAQGQFQPYSTLVYDTYVKDGVGNILLEQHHNGPQVGHLAFNWGKNWSRGVSWKWTGQWNETRADTWAHSAIPEQTIGSAICHVEAISHDYVTVVGPQDQPVQVYIEVTQVSEGRGNTLDVYVGGRFSGSFTSAENGFELFSWNQNGIPRGSYVQKFSKTVTLYGGHVYSLHHEAYSKSCADYFVSNLIYPDDSFNRAQQGIVVQIRGGRKFKLSWASGADYGRH
jgi:hypothetical protein